MRTWRDSGILEAGKGKEGAPVKRLGKRLFRGAAALLLGLLLPWGARAAWVSPFTDVTGEDWFCPAVEYVVEAGLFQGTAPDRADAYARALRATFRRNTAARR